MKNTIYQAQYSDIGSPTLESDKFKTVLLFNRRANLPSFGFKQTESEFCGQRLDNQYKEQKYDTHYSHRVNIVNITILYKQCGKTKANFEYLWY